MSISLINIRGLLAVAEHLSFKRAAEALQIGQPALSAQIRSLENSIGVQLVARTTRDVKLTAEGERFVARMRRLHAEMEAAVAAVRSGHELTDGRISFACIPSMAAHLLPRVIARFKTHYPGMTVDMFDVAAPAIERHIIDREVDFGIGGAPRQRDELDFTLVTRDPFVLVCHKSHELAGQTRVSLAQALEYPQVAMGRSSNIRAALDAHLATLGLNYQPAYGLAQFTTVGALVEANLGVALLPLAAVSLIRRMPDVRIIPFDDPGFARPVGLLTRRSESLSPAGEAFFQAMKKAFAQDDAARARRQSGKS